MLYGASLMLEFVTLVVLRIREPELKRGFRVPGGLTGAMMVGIFPLLLMSLAMVKSGSETVLGMNGMVFGGTIIAGGILFFTGRLKPSQAIGDCPGERTPNAALSELSYDAALPPGCWYELARIHFGLNILSCFIWR